MSRQTVFNFRVNKDERLTIERLAHLLQRSQSDAIRFVLVQVLKKLEQDPASMDLIKSIQPS
jgi:hypothetical protein